MSGASGAGKSTLLAALLGRCRLDGGVVTVRSGAGAVRLDHVDPADWWRHVAWVDQTPATVAGAVADNLRLGRGATLDDAALRKTRSIESGSSAWPSIARSESPAVVCRRVNVGGSPSLGRSR